MIVGPILVGILLGAAAGAGALMIGSSIWLALLIYSTTGAVSLLGLALLLAYRLENKDSVDQPKPYIVINPQRS